MLYMELYLYDYLKKTGKKAEIEIWGEDRGNDFYICHLRMMGERRPFSKAHMQYLGNYQGLSDTDKRKPILIYRRGEQIYRQETTVYVSKKTEQIEYFLIKEKLAGEKFKNRMMEKGTQKREKEAGQSGSAFFPGAAACVILIFLAANMVEALSSYKNMQEVIAVMEMLLK